MNSKDKLCCSVSDGKVTGNAADKGLSNHVQDSDLKDTFLILFMFFTSAFLLSTVLEVFRHHTAYILS